MSRVLLDLDLPGRKALAALTEFADDYRDHEDADVRELVAAIDQAVKHRSGEPLAKKARRLLAEGRLTVSQAAKGGAIVAECRGDSGDVYKLGWDPRASEWRCTCPNPRRCSHLAALQLVTVRPRPEGGS